MIKTRLKAASVSLSWGGAGDKDIRWRYEKGVQYLKDTLDIEVLPMTHTLDGSESVYQNPQHRAQDLMDAYKDDDIAMVLSCIGGSESVRILPYLDDAIFVNNPKPFIGYSDSTTLHLYLNKLGIKTYYGPSILSEFSENNGMFEYSRDYFQRIVLNQEASVSIEAATQWTSKRIPWLIENQNQTKTMNPHDGFDFIQGDKVVSGPLIGGCIEVLSNLRGTDIWPSYESFDEAILFLETSEVMAEPWLFEDMLRALVTVGTLERTSGIIFGKPYNNKYYQEYREIIEKIVQEIDYQGAIVANMNFGHTQPMFSIPYGGIGIIDPIQKTFTIKQ